MQLIVRIWQTIIGIEFVNLVISHMIQACIKTIDEVFELKSFKIIFWLRQDLKESGESDMIWFSSIPRLSKFRKFCCFYTQTFRNILYFVSRDKIWEILCQRRADRVIVTHGTDTIIQTGNFLEGDTKVFLNQKNVNLIQYTIFQKKSGSQKEMIY